MNFFIEPLSGTTNIFACLAWFLLAFIGAFTAIAVRTNFRYKNSLYIPYRWCWPFLIRDNLTNLILGCFITFILFRLSYQTVHTESNMGFAIVAGAISNELALLLIKFSFRAKK